MKKGLLKGMIFHKLGEASDVWKRGKIGQEQNEKVPVW
jgi:hypothetical protein